MLNRVSNIQSFFFQMRGVGNDTPLHTLIRSCHDIKQIQDFILKQGKTSVSKMARTINDNGEIPYDLVKKLNIDKHKMKQIENFLLNLAVDLNFKKFSDSINSKEVLARYQLGSADPLRELLLIACEVGNVVRSKIRESSSHPQVNIYTAEKRNALHAELHKVHRIISIQSLMYLDMLVKWNITIKSSYQFNIEQLFQDDLASRILEHGLANCDGLSVSAASLLRKQKPNLKTSIWHHENGDHAVLVINDMVVLDVFAGDVYKFSELSERLCDYRKILTKSSYVNVVTNYNPNFHHFEELSFLPQFEAEPEPERPRCNDLLIHGAKFLAAGIGIFGIYQSYQSFSQQADNSELYRP